MAVEVADLTARRGADVADFVRKLEQSGQSVKKFEAATGKAQTSTHQFGNELSRLPGPLGQVASRVSGFTALLLGPAGLLGGLAAVGVGLFAAAEHAADLGEELLRLSKTTGG